MPGAPRRRWCRTLERRLDGRRALTPQERDRLFLALRELEEHSNALDLVAFRYLEVREGRWVSRSIRGSGKTC